MRQPSDVVLFVVLTSFVFSCHTYADEYCVASWNVENLFDLDDDPNVALDEEFTPQAPKRWTRERLDIKLNNLAGVIRKMNGGRGPDVLGLCEVENRKVVEMLVAKLAPLGRKYQIVHKDSPSDRGIDTALIYDANVFALADSKFHFIDAERTRDIVEAALTRGGKKLYVFVNHWPSRNNDEWQRIMAAVVLRKRLDEILAREPRADIVLMGDFNDEPGNVSIAKFLRAATHRANLPPDSFYNTTAAIAQEGLGTHVWDDSWQLIDHIIVSPGLLDDDGFRWKPGSTKRVDFDELFFLGRWPNAIRQPSRSYSGNDFHRDGYSDHLAVTCTLSD